jgi:pimeloyl-ACP methyl ester carboxylesterase
MDNRDSAMATVDEPCCQVACVDHRTIAYGEDTIHYYVSGNMSGEAIVFLHAAFSDHSIFYRQVEYFSSEYRVITIDMLGHGLSGVHGWGDRITSTAAHIFEILRMENCMSAHIVGVSLGSLLAQDFALKYPGNVLSLTGVGGYNINCDQSELSRLQRREQFSWFMRALFSMESFRRHVSLVSVLDARQRRCFYASTRLFTRRSFTAMSNLSDIIKPRVVNRGYPLLILVGDGDTDVAIEYSLRWHRAEVGSIFHTIPNAGHCANMDNSFIFNGILDEFLFSVP